MAAINLKEPNRRIIFGLKLKLRRLKKGITPAELSERSGLSVSYLNEIEKGKKFPKKDKVVRLAAALDMSEQELLSPRLDKSMAPLEALLRSNFLNELPMDRFGIELAKVVEIIAGAPAHVGAFISTLVELARNYELREEHFYLAAMRSYQELYNNYFEDIEQAVDQFAEEYDLPLSRRLTYEQLAGILDKAYGVCVLENGLDDHPDLHSLRSLYLPNRQELLLNSRLNASERLFQLAKELSFHCLDMEDRAYTSGMLKVRSFEQVLNHYRATYFATALLMRRELFTRDLEAFFAKPRWDGNAFLDLQRNYRVSPEVLFHRLSNLLPTHFGLEDVFFQRVVYDEGKTNFSLDKELHLSRAHRPHRSGLGLHYCRRWLSLSLLEGMNRMRSEGLYAESMVGVQRSHYLGTDDSYLAISLARPEYPAAGKSATITVGILIDEKLSDKIAFSEDPAIQDRTVNIVCETCPLENCTERVSPPVKLQQRQHRKRIEEVVSELMEDKS